ncbi:MAG: serine/threonine-protein kinase [Polyangiales bacterium]
MPRVLSTAAARYTLGEKLGEGTLSEVWRATQESVRRAVAVKLLKPSVAPTSQLGQRFQREGALLATLSHQNIPHVYDVGVEEGERPFVVMELVEGVTLAALRNRARESVLPADVAAIIALRVARALEYTHLRGVVHRDVKPGNVLLGRGGEVKLADFGIARAADEGPDTLGAVGTPAYMSPEQVLGDRLDFRSDLFSFGITLYEMLTARRPFEEEASRTVMQKIRLDRYVPPRRVRRDVPAALERVLARCLEKVPAHRYPSTGMLCDDLAAFLASRGVASHEARLVGYLTSVGAVTSDDARAVLDAVPAAWTRAPDRANPLRRFAFVQLAAGAALSLALLGLEVSRVRKQESAPLPGPRPVGVAGVGFLRVLARPWAEVSVDGVVVDVTPTARAIPLAPGPHFVRLRNPAYDPEDRAVQVSAEGTVWVDVDLHRGEAPRAE